MVHVGQWGWVEGDTGLGPGMDANLAKGVSVCHGQTDPAFSVLWRVTTCGVREMKVWNVRRTE